MMMILIMVDGRVLEIVHEKQENQLDLERRRRRVYIVLFYYFSLL